MNWNSPQTGYPFGRPPRFGGGLCCRLAGDGVGPGVISPTIRASSSSLSLLTSIDSSIGSDLIESSDFFAGFGIVSATNRSTATLGTRTSPAHRTVGNVPALISW
jgi:hypothetical protein